jgi:hypothetical protein
MKKIKWLTLGVCIILIAGCASPKVKYTEVVQEDREGAQKFQLSQSHIQFTYPKDKSGNDVTNTNLEVVSVPFPDPSVTYSIAGSNEFENWGVKTSLSVTRRNDTMLLQSVGSQVVDNRVKLIGDLATTAATVAPFVLAQSSVGQPPQSEPGKKVPLPIGIFVSELLKGESKQCKNEPNGGEFKPDQKVICEGLVLLADPAGTESRWRANIEIGAIPVDAFPRASMPETSNSFVYSACRPAQITVWLDDGNVDAEGKAIMKLKTDASLVVADPRWLETLKYPDKGKVTAGTICGADSTSEDASLPTAMDYVNGLIGGAKTIKEAIEKAKAAQKPTSSSGTKS